MIVNFAKMHGLGNDFVVIDTITQGVKLNKGQLAKIADRKLGVGCDQVILLTPPNRPDADFYYKIYNADGAEAEQCVNGLRCAARYFTEIGLTNKHNLIADCLAGRVQLAVQNNQVTATWTSTFPEITTHKINYANLPEKIHAVSVGNPHAVLVMDNIDNHLVKVCGRKLSCDHIFPNEANIGFMQILERNKIKLRVFERGSGLTLACGSGAIAAVLVGNFLNLLDNKVTVAFKHGQLTVELDSANNTITMLGPASSVYIGRFKV